MDTRIKNYSFFFYRIRENTVFQWSDFESLARYLIYKRHHFITTI